VRYIYSAPLYWPSDDGYRTASSPMCPVMDDMQVGSEANPKSLRLASQ
jgi:hypothetical protein